MNIDAKLLRLEKLERQGSKLVEQMDVQAKRKDLSGVKASLKLMKKMSDRLDVVLKTMGR